MKKEATNQGFDKELKDFHIDLAKVRKEPLNDVGLGGVEKERFRLDLVLRLRDAQHTKSLIQHSEALARWTKALVLVTVVLAIFAATSVIFGMLNFSLERNRLEHVSRLEKEIAEIKSEVQKVAAQPRNPLGNPLDTESQKDK